MAQTAAPEAAKPNEPEVVPPTDMDIANVMCFGTIEPDHPECMTCPLNEVCAAESKK